MMTNLWSLKHSINPPICPFSSIANMAAPSEVLFTSEASGHLWNCCVWDPYSGTTLTSFKGGASGPRTLDIIHGEYLISATSIKPLIHMWPLQGKDQQPQVTVCPGKVMALTVTPDGAYCIAAVAERIHIWQTCTGHLMVVLSHHYQTVHCLACTDDGSHFVSGADDNLVLVWSMSSVLQRTVDPTATSKPRHTWSAHSLPITDLQVGAGGSRCRVVTASLDQTCKLWELASGQLLCSFLFDSSITSITMDWAEMMLLCGASSGKIYKVCLFEKPVRTERHIRDDDNTESFSDSSLSGHKKQVTCLTLSMDGSMLASGSHDQTVKLWDVPSSQCVRTLPHKGAVTNIMFSPRLPNMFDSDYRVTWPVQPFSRSLHTPSLSQSDPDSTSQSGDVIRIQISQSTSRTRSLNVEEIALTLLEGQPEEEVKRSRSKELETEVKNLKSINQQLYNYAVSEILKHD